jgi:hypothetical protein
MTPAETLEYLRKRAREGEEIVSELVVRVVSQLGETKSKELASRLGLERWSLRIPLARIRAEKTIGLARRRALSPLARDVERSLGRRSVCTDEKRLLAILRPLVWDSDGESRVRAGA